MGLSLAYHAALLGQKGIVVLERSYLASGASGRNGGGVRMQWSSPEQVQLMQASIRICRRFAKEMGINVWFRQGGYLFLVRDPTRLGALEQSVHIQAACGVRTRLLSPKDVRRVVPELNTEGLVGASYNPEDGVLFPWPFLHGYVHRALELGVRIHTYALAESLALAGGRVTGVHARSTLLDPWRSSASTHPISKDKAMVVDPPWRHQIRAKHVVLATGAWAQELATQAGVDLKNKPFRHEILTTEPLKPFLEPMVSVLGEGIYFSQSARGEIVGGMGDPNEPSSFDIGSSLAFLRRFARSATAIMPILAHVQVVRQWAGLYDASADGNPVIGEAEKVPNLTFLTGFTGHGFMMAPVIGELCAKRLVKGEKLEYFEKNGPDRFKYGVAAHKESMIIG